MSEVKGVNLDEIYNGDEVNDADVEYFGEDTQQLDGDCDNDSEYNE